VSEEAFRKRHEKDGYTVSTYFPPQSDWDLVRRFFDRVARIAEDYFPNRGDWDPFTVGHGGDILHIDGDHHVYLSTSCHHGDHEYCQSNTGLCGQKAPGVCKFCAAQCICDCHPEKESDTR
jgi:hypothetical protein